MKRKEPKQTSPVQLKKNRSSIGEVGSPTPASSMEEQKRRAKEWYENEEKKKGESTSAKSTAKPRSKTPTTKTPSKKEKAEVEEEPIAPRSTRKTARATSETPSKNRTLSARVEVEFINDDEEESEEEEEVVAPAPKVRKTSSAKITKEVKEEPAAAVKTPRTRKAAPVKVPTPILSPEPESPPALSKAQILEEERRRAREWYEEQERNKIVSPSSSAPKSASKTPVAPKSATKSATKPARSTTTTTPNKAAATPVGHPPTTGASGAQCPFAFTAEAERERVPETFNPNAHNANANAAPANDCHQTLAVSVALAAVPLGAIAYYDPKIAVTTLVILFVVSVVRRIFAMIADAEKNI